MLEKWRVYLSDDVIFHNSRFFNSLPSIGRRVQSRINISMPPKEPPLLYLDVNTMA